MLSQTEENYLKALFKLTFKEEIKETGTNDIASLLLVKPATVNNMLKKLKTKELVDFEKYGKISLTNKGNNIALKIIRKHRLWETFLFEKLDFTWDEVHEVAEQLEHIQSEKLINQLDKFLKYPKKDPHGDFIPNDKGELKISFSKTLLNIEIGDECKMIGVKDDSPKFLQYVEDVGLGISQHLKVIYKQVFDNLIHIEVNGVKSTVSEKFADCIYVSSSDTIN